MEENVKFNPPPVLRREGTPAPILLEDVWATDVALMFCRWKDTLARTGTRSPELTTRNVVAMPNTLLRMEYVN